VTLAIVPAPSPEVAAAIAVAVQAALAAAPPPPSGPDPAWRRRALQDGVAPLARPAPGPSAWRSAV
jgi:hypothetical protein